MQNSLIKSNFFAAFPLPNALLMSTTEKNRSDLHLDFFCILTILNLDRLIYRLHNNEQIYDLIL